MAANPEKIIHGNAKARAKNSGINFDLKFEDIVIPAVCPILLIPLFKAGGKITSNSPSLDRINSTKGYVKDNVRVISHKANAMKSDLSLEDVERLYNYMRENN